ncbi:MAG: DUF3231 family protein [Bacillota bacterium]|nr:DUF3231 family protein [Bacillota bacterium]
MMDVKKLPFISSEISGLWNSYKNNSLTKCIYSHFLNRVEDTETRQILQETFDKTTQHLQQAASFLNEAGVPLPDGFTDKDVNINAPRLFTDAYYLAYLSYISRVEMHNYTSIINNIARADVMDYFTQRITEAMELYKKAANLRLSKGIFIKAPWVEIPKQVQYIKNNDFIFDLFREKRSLILREITHMFSLIFSNVVSRATMTAYGQVSKEKQVSKYFFEGVDIASDKINELRSIFIEEGIPIPCPSDSYVTDSNEPPFSERLMLAHVLMISSSNLSNEGMAMIDNGRVDLEMLYMKYLGADGRYTNKGTDIMIRNRWMEQPPQAINHENLARL